MISYKLSLILILKVQPSVRWCKYLVRVVVWCWGLIWSKVRLILTGFGLDLSRAPHLFLLTFTFSHWIYIREFEDTTSFYSNVFCSTYRYVQMTWAKFCLYNWIFQLDRDEKLSSVALRCWRYWRRVVDVDVVAFVAVITLMKVKRQLSVDYINVLALLWPISTCSKISLSLSTGSETKF